MNTQGHPFEPSENSTQGKGDWLIGGGEMGKVVRSMDWSQTPLGPMESWPPSLRTTVSLALNSNFPFSLVWGPRHVQIYNDGYWPICASKHPGSMGQDFTECWASAWPAIGASFDSALAGTTAFLEDQRMFLDRLGYLEETFFTFSFSPIRDESGRVAGLFHPVTETTGKMIGQRRTRLLRDLTAHSLSAQSIQEGLRLAAQTLAETSFDVPFVLFYRLGADGRTAHLVARSGVEPGTAATAQSVDLTGAEGGWPLARAAASGAAQEVDVGALFGPLICGPYPEPIECAWVQAIPAPGQESTAWVMVAGVSSRLPLNEGYRDFFGLLASALGSVIANAHAFESQRQRAEALAEIDRAKTAFFSNVSHEFRTPLTLMLGPLEDELALNAGSLPEASRERLEIAHRNSLRLLKLVNTLLDFSRIEAGRMQATFEPVELAGFTAELAGNFRSACERAGLGLKVELAALEEPVFVDVEMWEKIVLNLLSNAFKFTLAGEIAVSVSLVGNSVEVAVRDTGAGIPAQEQADVFKRFHRVKGTQGRAHEGSGIGLALVRELVHFHGGSIRLQSEPGRGSTFTVSLPRGSAHLPASQIGSTRVAPSTSTGAAPYVEEALRWLPSVADATPRETQSEAVTQPLPSTTKARIVWADDNADMRDYVRRLLSERYEVEAVADGLEALEAIQRRAPDLVLSDVMMPRLDGFGLLKQLRAAESTRALSVVLLSARAGEEARIEGLRAGADAYLVKPFSARELLAVIGAQIEIAAMRSQTGALREDLAKAEALHASSVALHQSEERFRRFYESGLLGVVFWNTEGIITDANEKFLEILGFEHEDLLAARLDWFALTPPEHPPLEGRAIEGLSASGVPFEREFIARDGSHIPTLVAGAMLADARFHGVAFVLDIRGRKAAERALRESEEQFRSMVDAITQLAWMAHPDGFIYWYNQRWFDYTGTTPEDMEGWGWQRVHDPDILPTVLETWKASIASGQPFEMSFPLRAADGRYRWFLTRAVPLKDASGRLLRWCGTNTDINEMRDAKQEIHRLNTQLEERVTERTAQLVAVNKELEAFSYSVSHDLRSPLRAVDGFSQAVLEDYGDLLPEDGRRHLDKVRHAAQRMGKLIDDLLAFSRLGRASLHKTQVQTDELVRGAIEALSAERSGRRIEVRLGALPPCSGDSALLRQVWVNLLSNAFKYSQKRALSVVEIGSVATPKGLAFFVRDNGTGFDMRYVGKLFGVFQRLHLAEDYEGTGVGLALVQRIIHRHGGEVWAEGEVDRGATFFFTLG